MHCFSTFWYGIYRIIYSGVADKTCLKMTFLPAPSMRRTLAVPNQDKIDFRAACFCHKTIVDIGFVCSVCLSSIYVSYSTCIHANNDAPSILQAGSGMLDLPVRLCLSLCMITLNLHHCQAFAISITSPVNTRFPRIFRFPTSLISPHLHFVSSTYLLKS